MSTAAPELSMPYSPATGDRRRFADATGLPLTAWIALLFLVLLLAAALVPDPLAPLTWFRPARDGRFAWLARLMLSDPATIQFWTRLLSAALPTLAIGVGSAAVALAAGTIVGIGAGTNAAVLLAGPAMRLLALLHTFPPLILAIVAIVVFGTGGIVIGTLQVPHPAKLMLVIGLLHAPQVARITHAAMRAERGTSGHGGERALGASPMLIALRSTLLRWVAPGGACAAMLVGTAILCESSLSFLGVGVQPPGGSWGGMLAAGLAPMMAGQWQPVVIPGTLILATVCAFNLLGEALRERFDPSGFDARSPA